MIGHKPRAAPAPLRLTNLDFDALASERERSTTLQASRIREHVAELRKRVLAWARGVVSRLSALGIAVEADEHPRASADPGRLRIAFLRDADARSVLERTLAASVAQQLTSAGALDHVCFALAMDAASIAVSIELSPLARLDAKNLQARLADPALARGLTRALEALPEQFAVALGGSTLDAQQALRTGADGLARVLERAEDRLTPLWIGWSIPRSVAVMHSALLDEQLEDAIVALGPIYRLVAWARDNDLVALGRGGDEARGPRSLSRGEPERERALDRRDRLRAKRRASRDGSADGASIPSPRRGPGPSTRRATALEEEAAPSSRAAREADGPSRKRDAKRSARDAPTQRTTRAGQRPLLHSTLRTTLRAPATPRFETARPVKGSRRPSEGAARQLFVTEVDPTAPVERGTRVRVLAGPFIGKVGVVQELDGKGGARVMLGLLATRLDVKDLIASAEGRDRPSLATSHRKPVPGR